MLGGRRILVAEDNLVNQMVITGMLKKLDIAIEMAPNGLIAVERYAQDPLRWDLILMDCEMPELDGYAATGRIRQLEQEQNLRPVPIVALTAHALREQQQRCISAGMDEYLAKPLTFERLKQMLVQQFCRNGARN